MLLPAIIVTVFVAFVAGAVAARAVANRERDRLTAEMHRLRIHAGRLDRQGADYLRAAERLAAELDEIRDCIDKAVHRGRLPVSPFNVRMAPRRKAVAWLVEVAAERDGVVAMRRRA